MQYIGIDLGGTNIAVGVVDEKGAILTQTSTPTLPERPFTHSIPRFDGPQAPWASTMRPSFTTKSIWQPTAQCGQVVRTLRTSQFR